jgi:pilus assembly protein CpaB
MTRVRVFAVLVLALTAGGALAYGTYNYLQNVPVKTVTMPTRPVVVASADLQLGAELRSDDLKAVQWPSSSVPDGAFGTTGELVGRGLIAPVVRNEVVLPSKLAPKEAGAGLPPVIPAGMRAVSVRVNEVIGVAGYVLPGTRVDVVATANPTEQRADVTSKVVLANVQVLAAGSRIDDTADRGKPVQTTVVTLLVTPEQAERLALASTEGKIQLALRNPLDLAAPETPGIKTAGLLGKPVLVGKPVARRMSRPVVGSPAILPVPEPPPPSVEVIRGDKRAHEIVR